MSTAQIEVLSFSEGAFFSALGNPHCSEEYVKEKRQARNLCAQLETKGCKALLIEPDYTDKEYMHDYCLYYARCHTDYPKRCKRLHFFSLESTDQAIADLSSGNLDSKESLVYLQSHYLGFVVARPLPSAIIGRTLLRVESDMNSNIHFPCLRVFEANVAGVEFNITTLPFQEQDTVVAACASVALWSSLSKVSELFETPLVPPASLTMSATRMVTHTRPYPNHGLKVEQICNAITSVGLEPEVIPIRSAHKMPILSLIYGYLQFGIPIVMAVKIEGNNPGLHAMTVSGFSKKESAQMEYKELIPMIGSHLDTLFVHDDQIGPFVPLSIYGPGSYNDFSYPVTFKGTWKDKRGNMLSIYPEYLIIPIYQKVRITFLDVYSWLTRMHPVLELFIPDKSNVYWSAELLSTKTLRHQLVNDKSILASIREKLLVQPLPRFMWRTVLKSHNRVLIDLIWDATGLARSLPLVCLEWSHQNLGRTFANLTGTDKESYLNHILTPQLCKCLKEGLTKQFYRL